MPISEKLTYLNNTKQQIKENLNKFGSNITENDTFRSYSNVINDIYDKLPKVSGNGSNFSLENAQNGKLDSFGMDGNTIQGRLPSEYTQVDYITSSGSQYIDTGVNADTKLRVVLDMAYINPTGINQTMGAIRTGTPNKRYHLLSGTTKILFWVNDTSYDIIQSSDTNRHLWDLNVPDGKVVLDNTTTTTIPTNIDDTELNFWLFGRNSNASQYKGAFKIWACKMYYNGTLVRDFIPCYRNSDNEIGLYDLVNNVFYTNQGTGTFTYGSIAPTPDSPIDIEVVENEQIVNVHGKNLLPYPYTQLSATSNGVSFTAQPDGSVLVNGTATGGNANIKLYGDYQEINNKELFGKYVSGGSETVRVRVLNNTNNNYTVLAADTGSGAEIDMSTYTKGYIELTVLNGTTANNEVIKPMVLDSLDDTTYEPYQSQDYEIDLHSKNLFDKDSQNLKQGYILNDNGEEIASVISQYSQGFTSVNPNTTYTLSGTLASSTNGFRLYLYDENKNFLSRSGLVGLNSIPYTFTTDSDTYYLRFQTGIEVYNGDTVQLEEGSTATDYEPYYNYELCKIGDNQDYIYKTSGKNLFDIQATAISSNATKNVNDNSLTITATSSNANSYICYTINNIKKNTTYNISYNAVADNIACCMIRGYKTDNTYTTLLDFTSGTTLNASFTTEIDTDNLKIFLYASRNITSGTTGNKTTYSQIQLEEGSATDYEPFGTDWYVKKEIGKVVLDGSESWTFGHDNTSTGYAYFYTSTYDSLIKQEASATNHLCNRLTPVNQIYTNYNDNGNNIATGQSSSNKLRIAINTANSVIELTSWLSTHNLIVYYALATPTYETITNETLISQLESIEAITGVNNFSVSNDNNVLPTLYVSRLKELDSLT